MNTSGAGKRPAGVLRTLSIVEGNNYLLEASDRLPYQLLRILGHGHSGVVEEVKDTSTGANFARKTIRLYGVRQREERKRIFDNEIQIIQNLKGHHHIIRVFATYVGKRELGLILQPVADEGDLDSFLQNIREDQEELADDVEYCMPGKKYRTLLRAFGCLASGLAFMHMQKIRHKDIKPKNILIHQGQVLYTDFGYSLNTSQLSHSTTAGKPDFLTRRYSAPEVLDHDPRNSASDVFSLGCVFLEIVAALDRNVHIDSVTLFSEELDRIHGHLLEKRHIDTDGIVKTLGPIITLMTIDMACLRPKAKLLAEMMYSAHGYGSVPSITMLSNPSMVSSDTREFMFEANVKHSSSANTPSAGFVRLEALQTQMRDPDQPLRIEEDINHLAQPLRIEEDIHHLNHIREIFYSEAASDYDAATVFMTNL